MNRLAPAGVLGALNLFWSSVYFRVSPDTTGKSSPLNKKTRSNGVEFGNRIMSARATAQSFKPKRSLLRFTLVDRVAKGSIRSPPAGSMKNMDGSW
jgi:hypothetical protein